VLGGMEGVRYREHGQSKRRGGLDQPSLSLRLELRNQICLRLLGTEYVFRSYGGGAIGLGHQQE